MGEPAGGVDQRGERAEQLIDEVHAAVAAALRDEDQGSDPLVRVCRACVASLPVDGASIAVMSGTEHRETLYASDEVIGRMESLQFSLGEGPCFEAIAERRPVLVPDLARTTAEAWPTFAAELANEPVGALFAFPIQTGAITIGALDMYRREPGLLTTGELATALRVTDLASVALVGLAADGTSDGIDLGKLTPLRRGRLQVHQATGMLIAHLGIPPAQALARMRGYAFAAERLIEEVAGDIVARRLPLDTTDI